MMFFNLDFHTLLFHTCFDAGSVYTYEKDAYTLSMNNISCSLLFAYVEAMRTIAECRHLF